jgi:mono/diheme cytochrome c family protein
VRFHLALLSCAVLLAGCARNTAPKPLTAAAQGTQIVEVSGGKQVTGVGSLLPQPVVVQVNGTDSNPVTGALVSIRGEGIHADPPQALTDSSGQVTTAVRLGAAPGDYQIIAETPKSGGSAAVTLRETALGYEQKLGSAVNDQYCIRCHDNESTPERVSNFDNLTPAPHLYTDGATYNRFSDADLVNIITRGGPGLGKSPQMPAYGSTLKPAEVKALISYIRALADPPYQTPGVKYGK